MDKQGQIKALKAAMAHNASAYIEVRKVARTIDQYEDRDLWDVTNELIKTLLIADEQIDKALAELGCADTGEGLA